jgi:Fe2+ transport system protein B
MATKLTNALTKVSYILNVVCLVHVSATLVAVLSKVCYKGWLYRDLTKVCEQTHRCKIPSFKNLWFKIILKYKKHIKFCD